MIHIRQTKKGAISMQTETILVLGAFEGHNIRQQWYGDDWYFSVVDVIAALTDSTEPSKYWTAMKARVKKESDFQLSTICRKLKLPANDGKFRETDCANTENMLHIVQYIPSKRATPFREWLAQVGSERLEEIADPEQGLQEWKERAIRSFMAAGKSEHYARVRVDSILVRNAITGEWGVRGIKSEEFPILTNELHMGMFDISIQQHMGLKGYPVIKRGNREVYQGDLRKGMTPMELTVTMFGENLSRSLHIQRDSHGFAEVSRDVNDAAKLAREQRLAIEQLTGQPVVSSTNMQLEQDGGLWGLLPPPDEET
jgi:DNA-damage-inducible protein D